MMKVTWHSPKHIFFSDTHDPLTPWGTESRFHQQFKSCVRRDATKIKLQITYRLRTEPPVILGLMKWEQDCSKEKPTLAFKEGSVTQSDALKRLTRLQLHGEHDVIPLGLECAVISCRESHVSSRCWIVFSRIRILTFLIHIIWLIQSYLTSYM